MENKIMCDYGKHECEIRDFSASGMKGFYKICRGCNTEKTRKYRQNNREKYNDSVRDRQRLYMREWRENKNIEDLLYNI